MDGPLSAPFLYDSADILTAILYSTVFGVLLGFVTCYIIFWHDSEK